MFLLCFPAIERNLESEEQERVSADMRIRKSQVHFFSQQIFQMDGGVFVEKLCSTM